MTIHTTCKAFPQAVGEYDSHTVMLLYICHTVLPHFPCCFVNPDTCSLHPLNDVDIAIMSHIQVEDAMYIHQ